VESLRTPPRPILTASFCSFIPLATQTPRAGGGRGQTIPPLALFFFFSFSFTPRQAQGAETPAVVILSFVTRQRTTGFSWLFRQNKYKHQQSSQEIFSEMFQTGLKTLVL